MTGKRADGPPSGRVRVDRFVVGSGRCGSTLLSSMLACHPDVVSLHEVFTGLDWGRRFPTGPVTGAAVAELLSTPNQVTHDALSRGYDAPEITYPFGAGARYGRQDPLPWVLVSTLGRLSDDPDRLFDATVRWLSARGSAPIVEHYRALFDRWTADAGGSVWIERSGSSIDYLGDLVRLFGDGARFVHLHRDGREVALSMRNHALYRLAVQLYYGIVPEGVDAADTSPEGTDALVRAWLDGSPPVELYGRYWSEQVVRGCEAAAALPSARLLTVAFEDLVRHPVAEMTAMFDFFGLADAEPAAAEAAALVRGVPPRRVGELTPAEQTALEAACAPGEAALAEAM